MPRRFLAPALLAVSLIAAAVPSSHAAADLNALTSQRDQRVDEVMAADVQRIAALVEGNYEKLDRLLADDLTYGHSDGRLESKPDLLGGIVSGRQRYHAINPGERTVRPLGEDHALLGGTAELLVGPADAPFKLRVRYLAVYRHAVRGGWQLAAYQSTKLPAEDAPAH